MAGQISACPACIAAPSAEDIAARAAQQDHNIALSVPGIHCAACIATVERALERTPGVKSARVNLTLKRATIDAEANVQTDQLIDVLAKTGYEAHELDSSQLAATQTDKAGRDLLMRLAVAGFAMMNVMLLSIAVWSGADGATRDMFHWISAFITLPVIAFSAQPFFRNAFAALRAGRLNMDVPISLAILLAVGTSLYETWASGHHAYFDAAVSLTFFLLAGRYLDYRTRAIARSAAEELAALEVPRAIRLGKDGSEEVVPVAQLAVGDIIRIKPGGRLPIDGQVITGTSELDLSLLTGETLPVPVEPGAQLNAGAVNLTGVLDLRATAVGRDTSLHRLAQLVAVAESGRAQYNSLADQAAALYAPGVHILSALAFAFWWIWSQDLRMAINIAAAVLIITCPCALGLAVPAVTTAASGRLFKKGMLIKNATALERLARVDTVVFDKTGTLTTGQLQLDNKSDFAPEALAIARALANGSAHPLAQAIWRQTQADDLPQVTLVDAREIPGQGIEGHLSNGCRVTLGRADWLGGEPQARTATWLKIGGGPAQPFTFIDSPRDGAAAAVAALHAANIQVHLLSGDAEAPVADLAKMLGITQWRAGVLPEEKSAHIQHLRDTGAHVLMVGDGLNDTVALAAADVSISPASALDAARVASDIVLLGADLRPIADAVLLARKATKRIRENFQIATIYNVIAVPIAIVGLATPLMAALAMSASSITVSLNALRLGRVKAGEQQ